MDKLTSRVKINELKKMREAKSNLTTGRDAAQGDGGMQH